MDNFRFYRKKNLQEMRPYIPGEDLSGVLVSNEDVPGEGGMIARNACNRQDQWYAAKEFFQENYVLAEQETNDFGWAKRQLKMGKKVARAGWNGKDMFLFLIPHWTYTDGKQDNYPNLPFIAMKTAQNNVVPWLASQTDVLADDWYVVD